MTEVLHSPSHFSSSSGSTPSDTFFQPFNQNQNPNLNSSSSSVDRRRNSGVDCDCDCDSGSNSSFRERSESLKKREKEREELSFLALLVALFRKSLIGCSTEREDHLSSGLPVEFEPEVPRRAPSASTSVFGVSTESMQLSYDTRGNCVPTILILMQRRLYAQGGLQVVILVSAGGRNIRITADNSQEEFVRDQLNGGIIPEDIDIHCLAGLIKAWFRELPTGVLDPLEPEDVMQCQTEDDCVELVRLLPLTESSLLDWAINLMADVVQEEQYNKMNAHNIAMVFAPNMTQMADPLTALMYAVQVMNFLKTLITKRLQDREDARIAPPCPSCAGPSDESGHQSPSQACLGDYLEETEVSEPEHYSSDDEPVFDSPHDTKHSEDGDDSDDSPFHWQSFKGLQSSLKIRTGPLFQSSASIVVRKDPASLSGRPLCDPRKSQRP
uniref:Rho-GAP domain-containing protein n=1 Tax=Chenopodium quinoa TaxID=63459 RepID=A0A803MW28_CHEQI